MKGCLFASLVIKIKDAFVAFTGASVVASSIVEASTIKASLVSASYSCWAFASWVIPSLAAFINQGASMVTSFVTEGMVASAAFASCWDRGWSIAYYSSCLGYLKFTAISASCLDWLARIDFA